MDGHNGELEAQNGVLESLRPVVADSHNFDEEQNRDSDPDRPCNKKVDPQPWF